MLGVRQGRPEGWSPREEELPARGATARPAKLAIRPGNLRFASEPGDCTIEGVIAKSVYVGRHIEYSVDTASGSVFISNDATDAPLPVGTTAHLDLASARPIIICD